MADQSESVGANISSKSGDHMLSLFTENGVFYGLFELLQLYKLSLIPNSGKTERILLEKNRKFVCLCVSFEIYCDVSVTSVTTQDSTTSRSYTAYPSPLCSMICFLESIHRRMTLNKWFCHDRWI